MKKVSYLPLLLIALFVFGTGETYACNPMSPTIISWWPLDQDGSDIVSNNNSVSTGSVTYVPGKVGNGVTFGTNGFIEIPHSSKLTTQQFSVNAWVRPDGSSTLDDWFGNVIIIKTAASNETSYSLSWRASDSRFVFTFGENPANSIVSDSTFASGSFYHVAGTYDGAVFKLYVNGSLEGEIQLSKTIVYNAQYPWVIGSNPVRTGVWARTWNGVIDEVVIHNSALSAEEVKFLFLAGSAGQCSDLPIIGIPSTLPDGNIEEPYSQTVFASLGTPPYNFQVSEGRLPPELILTLSGNLVGIPTQIGRFSFTINVNDAMGKKFQKDYTVNIVTCSPMSPTITSWWPLEQDGNDIVSNNNSVSTGPVTYVPGKVGNGVTFGPKGFIEIPHSSNLTTQQFSVNAWVRPDGSSTLNDWFGNVIIIKTVASNDTSYSLSWRATDSRFVFTFGENPKDSIASANTFVPGSFYHVAGTYDGAVFKLYVNGGLEGELNLRKTIVYNADYPWVIGSNPVRIGLWDRTWNGVIDEVAIHNSALRAEEVQLLFLAGSAGQCTESNQSSSDDSGVDQTNTDSDGDGTPDGIDNCPGDPGKIDEGVCGCGVTDIDSDGDGAADCIDDCLSDYTKTEAGVCGCGVSETDTDNDGTPDCTDGCPLDSNKIESGICGCGLAETDSDSDGTPDCNDNCPSDSNKTEPDEAGCGYVEETGTGTDDVVGVPGSSNTETLTNVPVQDGIWLLFSVLTGLYFLRRQRGTSAELCS